MSGRAPLKSATILVVDDNPSVLTVVQTLLESRGHKVLAARSGEQALALFEQHQAGIDLAIVDVIMPSLSGPDLVEKLLAVRANLAVLFISGTTDDARVKEMIHQQPYCAFLPKPFTIRDLESAVLSLLQRATMAA